MPRSTKRIALITAAVLISVYCAAAVVFPRVMVDTVNAVLLGVSIMVTVAYGPSAWLAMRVRDLNRQHHLIIGIALTWFGAALHRAWAIVATLLDRPAGMLNNPVLGFILLVVMLGGLLHLTAPGTFYNRGHIIWYIAVGASIAITAAVAMFNINIPI